MPADSKARSLSANPYAHSSRSRGGQSGSPRRRRGRLHHQTILHPGTGRATPLRSSIREQAAAETIVIGEIELDVTHRTVRKAGTRLPLTPKEFELLHYLMSHAGLPLAHSKLLRAVWGEEYGEQLEYLRTFMHQLRKKLENDPSSPEYLLTDLHYGYRFRGPGDTR